MPFLANTSLSTEYSRHPARPLSVCPSATADCVFHYISYCRYIRACIVLRTAVPARLRLNLQNTAQVLLPPFALPY